MKRASFVAALSAARAQRLAAERRLVPPNRSPHLTIPLLYLSPYPVAMSSLGYQAVFRLLHDPSRPEIGAERAFLPDDVPNFWAARLPLTTFETGLAVGQAPLLLFSIAYELEILGLFSCLELAGLPLLRSDRDETHPLVVGGGPLTFSNPLPLAPFVDAMVIGEAEDVLPQLLDVLIQHGVGQRPRSGAMRHALHEALAQIPSVFVPSLHGETLPKTARADDDKLPATSAFVTPHTELSSMFLIEAERGCSRGCAYCVMRRSTNGGMRLFAPERICAALPPNDDDGDGILRIGLVGAAVTDHPGLVPILHHIVRERGLSVGVSSLRADRLTDEMVELLSAGGYRTLTVAADGASERLRDALLRKTRAKHLLRAAELAHKHGMKALKVYLMVGTPDETDADIDELIAFTAELTKFIKVVYGIAPFVAKRNTPLDAAPFAGIATVDQRLFRLQSGLASLKGRAQIRPTTARWALVEYLLAQGDSGAGLRALVAHRNGGTFAAWRQAFGLKQTGAVLPEHRRLPVL